MSKLQALYDSKRMTASDAAGQVRDGDTVVVPTGVGEPPALLHALSERRHELRDVAVSQILPLRKFAISTRKRARTCATTPTSSAVRTARAARPAGGLRAGLFLRAADADRARPVTGGRGGVAGLADGRARLLQPSLAPDYTMAAIRRARRAARGESERALRQRRPPECTSPGRRPGGERRRTLRGRPAEIGPVQQAIGKYVAELIDDGSTPQIGYGGIPDAVVVQLQHKRELGIHTEMLGDGIRR